MRRETALVYSTYLSGNGAESARGLALDSRNKIYVIGATTSTRPARRDSFVSRNAGRDSGLFAGHQPIFRQQD